MHQPGKNIVYYQQNKFDYMHSVTYGLLCLAREEALFAEPERSYEEVLCRV